MATVVNKSDLTLIKSVNTPDYDPTFWLIDPPGLDILIANKVPQKYWKFDNDDIVEMEQSDKDVILAAELESYRVSYIESTGLQVQRYIEGHYVDRKQRTLTFLYSEAQRTDDVSTQAYIQKAWDWVITVIQGYYAIKRQIITAKTIEEIRALIFDPNVYDITDPKVTIEQVFLLQGR